jgi:hypothetical protein
MLTAIFVIVSAFTPYWTGSDCYVTPAGVERCLPSRESLYFLRKELERMEAMSEHQLLEMH